MAFEMAKERITFSGKPPVAFAETQQKLDQLHRLKQQVNDELSLLTEKVEFTTNFSKPLRIIPISDTHLFSVQTDITKSDEIFKKLEDENTFGIIMGDIIEGANPNITSHIGDVEIDFGKQIKAARKKLEPYIKAGKIICMSSTYNGHEGWGSKYLGIDVVELIADGFTQTDGSPLRVLINGGRLVINLANGETHTELIYHSPGGGGSDEVNPLGSQRNRLWEYISHRGAVNGAGGGHLHHRAGVSKELVLDLKTGKEKSHILFANGTTKGNDPNRQDLFLTAMSKGPTVEPGVQLIFNQGKRDEKTARVGDNVWVSYGYNKGEILYEAAKLWDMAEKKRRTKGHIEEIISREKHPEAKFDRGNSRTKIKANQFDTPMFENFKWKFNSSNNLPILITDLANTRYTSTSFEERDIEEYKRQIAKIESNPFHYGLVMRHIVDSDVSKQFDRTRVLDRVVAHLKPVADQKRLLGFMMSATLLDERWKKDVLGDWEDVDNDYPYSDGTYGTHRERERRGPLWPGTYIYRGLGKQVPLYLNQSFMTLDFDGLNYGFMSLDHLAKSGSEFDMFRGLVQAKRKNMTQVDVVMGGHMPGAGFMETPDGIYIATGWFSEYDSGGKANSKRSPLGGQGTIIFPKEKMAFGTSTFSESVDTHNALLLHKGLKSREKEGLR